MRDNNKERISYIMTNQNLFDYLQTFESFQPNISSIDLSEMERSIIKDSIKATFNKYTVKNNNKLTTIIYVTNNKQYDRLKELLDLTDGTEYIHSHLSDEEFTRISLLFPNVDTILIPKKAKRNISKYVSRKLRREIHPDLNIANEKCLVVLSYFAPTYYSDNKWKPLNATKLHEQLKNGNDNTFTYKKVLKALKKGTPHDGAVIEPMLCPDTNKETYEVGKVSKQFRLTQTYLKAGLETYVLTDPSIIQQRNKTFYKYLFKANENVICNNLIGVYQQVTIPTAEQILLHGKKLSKKGYLTKKGKKLTMMNKHKLEYWKDAKQRSFVERDIELFNFLTGRGFMIPNIGTLKAGGRVTDSFNLMPFWIRQMVKINDEPIVECDFSAMHPNLASKLYNGTGSHISHEDVADYLDINKKKAKIEHLSFFNKPFYPSNKEDEKGKGSMVQSAVFKYYEENEPLLIENIREDKLTNGFKASTLKLFMLEVDIMTEIIKRLNSVKVYVLYVYDALYCAESDKVMVTHVMRKVIKEFGVNTDVG